MNRFALPPGLTRRLAVAAVTGVLPALALSGPASAAATNGSSLSISAGNGGSTITPGPALNSGFDQADSVSTDGQGGYYVAEQYKYAVVKVNAQGQLSVLAGVPKKSGTPTPGPAAQSRLRSPVSVAAGPDGTAYIADDRAEEVLKVDASGQLSVLAGDGNWPARGAAISSGPALQTPLDPWHVTVAPDGAVYASTASQVLTIADGQITVIAGNGMAGAPTVATASPLRNISGIAVDSVGNVYIASSWEGCIVRVNAVTHDLARVSHLRLYRGPDPGPGSLLAAAGRYG